MHYCMHLHVSESARLVVSFTINFTVILCNRLELLLSQRCTKAMFWTVPSFVLTSGVVPEDWMSSVASLDSINLVQAVLTPVLRVRDTFGVPSADEKNVMEA